MSRLIKRDKAYASWISELKARYQRSQIKASVAVNTQMLTFYWSLGRDIVGMQAENRYGSGFYTALSSDLKRELPDAKGFSPRNLHYMKRFYELFTIDNESLPQAVADSSVVNAENLPQLVADSADDSSCNAVLPLSIPWGHIRLLIDKCSGNRKKALFYVRKTLENNWSRAVLANFLSSDLYDRQGKAASSFSTTLPEPQAYLAQEMTKDPYQFDFLTIRERYDEKELKDALMDNITTFLLELGSGFAFLGREYRVKIGAKERFIDMLFYHIRLRCYVVLEVKVTEFEPAYLGQLGTYVVAVNHQLKTEGDNPTIGLLVCKSLDKVEAQYALEATSQPIGVSGYELAKLIPEDFKGSLPTIEEIEQELGGRHE